MCICKRGLLEKPEEGNVLFPIKSRCLAHKMEGLLKRKVMVLESLGSETSEKIHGQNRFLNELSWTFV